MSPSLLVLGTAQDGGVPHAGCACATCEAARRDARHRRRVACVALLGRTGRALLVDATPDLPEQLAILSEHRGGAPPVPEAVLVTHAHVGHYLGLAWFGEEALDARDVPLWCTPAMTRFLAGNRPWADLLERGGLRPRTLGPEEPVAFDGLALRAFLVPHRARDTDTVGLEVRGPTRRLVYLPDADRLTEDLATRIRRADTALVDGTFYGRGEIPHRDPDRIPHPFVEESVELLQGGEGEVHFTHLNHTNPLLRPDPARRPPLPPGFAVLQEGRRFDL